MKKLLSVLLVVVLLHTSLAAVAETAAEEPTFDKTVFSSSELYNYDKFSKEWNVQGAFVRQYSDATVQVALLLFDVYVEEGWGPELRIIFFNKETQTYEKVTAFRVIADDKLFCFETLDEGTNCGYAFAGEIMEQLFETLITAKEVAFQFDHTDKYGNSWTATIDPITDTELAELRAMALLMRDSHAWSINPIAFLNDYLYGATVE